MLRRHFGWRGGRRHRLYALAAVRCQKSQTVIVQRSPPTLMPDDARQPRQIRQQFSFWHLVVFWGAAPCDEFGWEWLTGVRAGVAAVLRRPRFAAGLARKERSGKW